MADLKRDNDVAVGASLAPELQSPAPKHRVRMVKMPKLTIVDQTDITEPRAIRRKPMPGTYIESFAATGDINASGFSTTVPKVDVESMGAFITHGSSDREVAGVGPSAASPIKNVKEDEVNVGANHRGKANSTRKVDARDDAPDFVSLWEEGKRLISSTLQINLQAKDDVQDDGVFDDGNTTASTKDEVEITTEDDFEDESVCELESSTVSYTSTPKIETAVSFEVSGGISKVHATTDRNYPAFTARDSPSTPRYDGAGWGPKEFGELGRGTPKSVIRHHVPEDEDTVHASTRCSFETARSSQHKTRTDVIDFAYTNDDDKDNNSATSSMTEINITGTDKGLYSAGGEAATDDATGYQIKRSLRGDSFKFPSPNDDQVIEDHGDPQINDNRLVDINTTDKTADEAKDYFPSSYAPSVRSSRLSVNGVSRLTPLSFRGESEFPYGFLTKASFIEPLKYKMQPRDEPGPFTRKPKARLVIEEKGGDSHYDWHQVNSPPKAQERVVKKPGSRVDSEDVVFYIQQCHQIHENAKLSIPYDMEFNHDMYLEMLNSANNPTHSFFRRAVFHLIAAETMTIYRPTMASLRLSNYDMKIVRKHKEETNAAEYYLTAAKSQILHAHDNKYIDYLKTRVAKLESDWDEVVNATYNPPASAPASGFISTSDLLIAGARNPFNNKNPKTQESGAIRAKGAAKGFVKDMVKSASQSNLKGKMKRIFSREKKSVTEEEKDPFEIHEE